MNNEYLFPVGKGDLIKRFSGVFSALKKDRSSTLVALPHTGRTSHIRFILSQKNLLEELGIDDRKIMHVDIDRTSTSLESFASELLLQFNTDEENAMRAIRSCDTYVITSELLRIVKKTTQSAKVIIIVTLNKSAHSLLNEIDMLMVSLQKAASNFPVSILWSVDTSVYRNYSVAHSSSTFFDNVYFFPTFSETETLHSLNRISNLKGKKISRKLARNTIESTGGVSGLFHCAINSPGDFSTSQRFTAVTQEIRSELMKTTTPDKLLGSDIARKMLDKVSTPKTYMSIKLKKDPTAQEIRLIKLFRENIDTPLERDDIAKSLWGIKWKSSYSDWAIDKAIHRLRGNIESKNLKIVTVRNLGYQMIEI